MKKFYRLIAVQFLIGSSVFAQNVGINTDGSNPNGDAILHIKNHSAATTDSSVVRIENEQNGANDVTGLEIYNSGTGNTARWDVYIPASGSTDLRFKNNGTDRITIQNDGDVGIGTTSPVSGLDVQTSLGYAVTTITSATTLDNTHNVVLCNTGPYTVTLPAAAANTGKIYYIKNIDQDGDDITIDGNVAETIDDELVYTLETYKQAIRIISDGANWHIIEESGLALRIVTNPCRDTLFLGNGTFTVIAPANKPAYCNCDGTPFEWNDVINPTTGDIWMDRSLGASRVANDRSDDEAYGDLFQWGRAADGHQCRNSNTTNTTSDIDFPGHNEFIIGGGDWRTTQKDELWQGINGINNPCPSGYRLPTDAEAAAERGTWTPNNLTGAFASPLRWTDGGFRDDAGAIRQVGGFGYYWTSTVNGTQAGLLHPTDCCGTFLGDRPRQTGIQVRCIRD